MLRCRIMSWFVVIALAGTLIGEARAQDVPKQVKKRADKEKVQRSYDISDFVEHGRRRGLTPTQKAASVVQNIVSSLGLVSKEGTSFENATIQVINGTRLIVQADLDTQEQIASLLGALRRMGLDTIVQLRAQLFEVDDAFYTKLKNAKPIDWEEQERRFLGLSDSKPGEAETLFDFLPKQKLVLKSDDVKADDRTKIALLSRQHMLTFLPKPEEAYRDQHYRQSILEGVAFAAHVRVSSDHRYVRVQVHETSTDVRQVKKIKVVVPRNGKVAEIEAEIPFLNQATHEREIEIPDCGTMLVPVHYRPKTLADKNRWWVLSITPRIWIPEEEQEIRRHAIESMVPSIVKDILTSPGFKLNREFYGTPGDKHVALMDSDAWTWPKELKLDVPGHQVTPAARTGKRLLGIRIDRVHHTDSHYTLTVSLVNAGGSDNGAVVGSGTIRYTGRQLEKGWRVELAEP